MENSPNIYKTARNAGRFSVEQAAELAGISVSSLKDYEAYIRIPSIYTVERMCEAYHSKVLAYQHMRLICGRIQVVPEVQERDLQAATIRLVNRVLAFCEKRRDRQLLQIAEDGEIDAEERPLYEEIVAEVQALIQASTELTIVQGNT